MASKIYTNTCFFFQCCNNCYSFITKSYDWAKKFTDKNVFCRYDHD